jgi:murein L,D-transpeptidase YcbB/YkuD
MKRARASSSSLLLSLISIAAAGCHHDVDRAPQLAASVRQIVERAAANSVRDPVWSDVRTFYEKRQDAPAWMSEKKLSGATKVLEILRSAPAHGFASEDYGEPQMTERLAALELSDIDAPDRLQQIASLDVRLTTALLGFGRDVAGGRTSPTVIDPRWKARRELPDLAKALGKAVDGDLESWVDAVRPPHAEYAALQRALTNLLAEREKLEAGDWPRVPAGTYALGKSNPSLAALRQRLAASGQLTNAAASNTSPIFSEDDEAGVRAFQELHGLKATGVADAPTLAAMNVSLDARVRQVAINLERWRWMPNDLGARHLIVNIPYFHLFARENGKRVKDIRVVVGKADEHKTPIFSSVMTTVVFSPYWNIPDSIVEAETAPAIARDPGYLEKNNIEILDMSKSGATPVDSASVKWDDAHQLKRLAFRQRPGPANALGYVKFLFPNDFDVYLHDTPSDALFSRQSRALSHGCVRVEEPEALARYVLRGDPNWNDAKILNAMHAGEEKHVKLPETIPVHIVYFTAWVDDNGGLHFQPDVYGYDADQAAHSSAL